MLDFLCDILWSLFGVAVELFLFIIVDRITKEFLVQACNENEKQAVWLLECAVLFLLCSLIYAHHVPYFLFALAWSALIYIAFRHRVDFGIFWRLIRTTWQDFNEHEESLRGENTSLPEQPQSGATLPLAAAPAGLPNQVNTAPFISPHQPEPALALQASEGGARPQNQVNPEASLATSIAPNAPVPAAFRNQQLTRNSNEPRREEPSSTRMVASSAPAVGRYGSFTEVNKTCNNIKTSGATNFLGSVSSSVKSWLTKPFTRDCLLPPGLENNRQGNLCFINCILQTLSRSPKFMDHIETALASGLTQNLSDRRQTFLQEAVSVFRKLTMANQMATSPGQFCYHKSPLHTAPLRKAISDICNLELVVDPYSGDQQQQQDASEFLLWLLNNLHEALKVTSTGDLNIYGRPSIHATVANSSSRAFLNNPAQAALNKIRADYNNPSSADIQIERRRCLGEIANANGLIANTYVRPVTVFSDLDWLLHKDQNNSVIDDQFTGQQVSACICDRCSRISVSTETFWILHLPIPSSSAPTDISFCFGKLKEVEKLTGQNSRKCDFCSSSVQNHFQNFARQLSESAPTFQTSTPNGPVQRGSSTQSSAPDIGILSPIERASHDPRVEPMPHMISTPMSSNPSQPTYKNPDGLKQTSVRRLPDCLVVQLLRFGMADQTPYKLGTPVTVSVDPIDLSSLIIVRFLPTGPMFYSLYGLCLHDSGSTTQSGHYYAYALASDGQWYVFNDAEVEKVDIRRELDRKKVQESIYLLFYRKL